MITIYSKDGCPYCVKAKDLLEEYSIEHTVIKIDEDDTAKDFVVSEGHRTVPQLYVKETLLVEGGFDGLSAVPKELIISRVGEILDDYTNSAK
jgi:glutaredoxin